MSEITHSRIFNWYERYQIEKYANFVHNIVPSFKTERDTNKLVITVLWIANMASIHWCYFINTFLSIVKRCLSLFDMNSFVILYKKSFDSCIFTHLRINKFQPATYFRNINNVCLFTQWLRYVKVFNPLVPGVHKVRYTCKNLQLPIRSRKSYDSVRIRNSN